MARQLHKLRRIATFFMLAAIVVLPGQTRASDGVEIANRILDLENLGRARPREVAESLQLLLPVTGEFSAERLELLTVEGLMLGMAALPTSIEVAAPQLEAWGRATDSPLAQNARAAALLVRGCFMARSGDLPTGVAQIEKALETLPNSSTDRERYRFVSMAAYVSLHAGNLDAAVRLGHEGLTLADRTAVLWRQGEIRSLLAYFYFSAKQANRAIETAQEAVAFSEKSGDALSMARAYSIAGSIFGGTGDVEAEGRYYALAAKEARRAGSKSDEVRFLANMADFSLKKNDYVTALASSERALTLSRELGDTTSEALALFNIGISYIAQRQVALGKRYCQESMAIDRDHGLIKSVSESQRELGTYLEKAGDLPAALDAYLAHRKSADAIFGSEQQKAILSSQEQYDTERRTRLLEILSREREIDSERLIQGSMRHRLWWLLAVALAASILVITLLARRVRQTNSRLEVSNELLREQGERDPLTGLANRRYFDAAMRDLSADGKLRGSVYLVDIDHFKRINDTHGHSAGDAVLVEVSQRLQSSLRDHDLLVRWGGEEFLIMVQSLSREQVDTVAQRMLDALADAPVELDSRRVPVTASIGYSDFSFDATTPGLRWEKSIELADAAMYLAKHHGRNRAYGARLSSADHATNIEGIASSLESAQRAGQIELTLLKGQASPSGEG